MEKKLSKAEELKQKSDLRKKAKEEKKPEPKPVVKNNDWKNFNPFVLKRLAGAEAITKSSKEKGGASLLTYEHYNAKLPIYKTARSRFDVEKAKHEFTELQSKLSYNMEQTEFQKLMGQMEVLGELIIKQDSNLKHKTEEPEENYADGGEIEWGEDLGNGFSIGSDVYITDAKSLKKGKTGFVSGLVGKDLLVTISENCNESSVVVSKNGVKRLDEPEFAKGGKAEHNMPKVTK